MQTKDLLWVHKRDWIYLRHGRWKPLLTSCLIGWVGRYATYVVPSFRLPIRLELRHKLSSLLLSLLGDWLSIALRPDDLIARFCEPLFLPPTSPFMIKSVSCRLLLLLCVLPKHEGDPVSSPYIPSPIA